MIEIIGTWCYQNQYEMMTKLNNSKNGYRDYDISGFKNVYRACVPFGIKNGEVFNVYFGDGIKDGVLWVGDLTESIKKHLSNIES